MPNMAQHMTQFTCILHIFPLNENFMQYKAIIDANGSKQSHVYNNSDTYIGNQIGMMALIGGVLRFQPGTSNVNYYEM